MAFTQLPPYSSSLLSRNGIHRSRRAGVLMTPAEQVGCDRSSGHGWAEPQDSDTDENVH